MAEFEGREQNIIRRMLIREINRQLSKRLLLEIGIVEGIDTEKYKVHVRLRNVPTLPSGRNFVLEDVPVSTLFAGGSQGLLVLPKVGDLVIVGYIGGSLDDPVILGRLFNEEAVPPSYTDNEVLIKHSSGATVKIDANGKIEITPAAGQQVNVADGSQGCARIGDAVTIEAVIPALPIVDPALHTYVGNLKGTISAGSSKVKIG